MRYYLSVLMGACIMGLAFHSLMTCAMAEVIEHAESRSAHVVPSLMPTLGPPAPLPTLGPPYDPAILRETSQSSIPSAAEHTLKKGRVMHGQATFFEARKYPPDSAATHHFPIGTHVRVTNLANHQSVKVVILSTWPRTGHGRTVIDLLLPAFKEIADWRTGRIEVKVEEIVSPRLRPSKK